MNFTVASSQRIRPQRGAHGQLRKLLDSRLLAVCPIKLLLKNAVAAGSDPMMPVGVYLQTVVVAARNWSHKVMAAGDAQRVWFDEMIERLRLKWHREMQPEELVKLRDELDEILQQIRSDRQLRPPVLRCPECGHVGEVAASHVSVRAMICQSSAPKLTLPIQRGL